jgi:TonB family protein
MLKHLLYAIALISPIHLIAQAASDGPTFTPMNDTPPIITECEDSAFDCTMKRLQAFVDRRLNYPREDYPKKIKGKAVLQFTIDSQGQMEDIICLIPTTPAMGKKAEGMARYIQRQFEWKPGLNVDKAVDVIYYLPIRFDPDRHMLAPPPPPPPPPKQEEIFKIVAEMPRFPGCEDLPKAERKTCANKKLLAFIYKNLDYPEQARNAKATGTVFVQFIVEKDGSITSIKALNDPGYGLAKAAVDVVELMKKEDIQWIPGPTRGRPVKVQFKLPIKFDYKTQKDAGVNPE